MENANLPASAPSEKYRELGTSTRQGGTAGSQNAGVEFSSIWSTIRQGKWWILLTTLFVAGAVTAYTWTLPKVYESTAILSIQNSSEVQSASAGAAGMNEGIELSKEIGLLKNSGTLTERVVERVRATADTIDAKQFPIFDPVDGKEPTAQDITTRLRKQTAFKGDPAQAMIRIKATSEHPKEASVIANAFAEEYQQFSREMARSGVSAARTFLEKQRDKRRKELEQVEREWERFSLKNNVATDGKGGERVAQEYVELEARREELQFQLEQEQRMKETLEARLKEMRPKLRGSVEAEQRAENLRTQINVLQKKRSELQLQAGEYYENNPSLRGNEDKVPQLAELKRRINKYENRKDDLTEELVSVVEENGLDGGASSNTFSRMEDVRSGIEEHKTKIRQLKEQVRGLEEKIANTQGTLSGIPRQKIRRQQIQRRLTQAEEFYNEIAGELRKVEVAEETELGYVSVVRSAIVPTMPVSPNFKQNILLGVLLGLGFGIGLAFIIQSTNSRIRDPKDIEAEGYNLLGVVPSMDEEIASDFDGRETVDIVGRQLSTKLLPLLNPWSNVTENYRLMRTNLQYPYTNTDADDSPQVLLVTSPEPEDGKTTTAVNLALTFALNDREVLLIDGDLRRPNAHNLMDLNSGPGLAEVLSGEKTMADVGQPFIENFTFLAAGETDVAPAEMLDSERMQGVFAEARERADIVVIDTPPVLAANDALILALGCDSTLVVANAGTTDRRALEQVKKTFSGVGVSVSAVIFNRFNPNKGQYEYGYQGEYYEDRPNPVITESSTA